MSPFAARPLLLLAACMLVASPAFAAPEDDVPIDSGATDLVREGVSLRRAHKNVEALVTFRRAYERDPVPATRAQIAFAEQALGQWRDAEGDLVAALASEDAWVDHHRADLAAALRVIEAHLAWLRIDVSGARGDVLVDDQRVDTGRELRVVVGTHRVLVRGPAADETRDVDVAPREHARAIFLVDAAPAAPPPRDSRPSPSRVGPVLVGGIALAGIAAGVYFGVDALEAKSAREQNCHDETKCNADGVAADKRLRTSATASTIAFALGGAALVSAAIWWIVQTPRGVGLSVGPRGASVVGRF